MKSKKIINHKDYINFLIDQSESIIELLDRFTGVISGNEVEHEFIGAEILFLSRILNRNAEEIETVIEEARLDAIMDIMDGTNGITKQDLINNGKYTPFKKLYEIVLRLDPVKGI